MSIIAIKSGISFRQTNQDYKSQISPQKVKGEAQNNFLEKSPVTDTVEISSEGDINNASSIGIVRLSTGFLTDAQVAEINSSRKLPENAKFIPNGQGQYYIANNFFGLRAGTQTLPEGFEVKKNIIGQAIVVPADTKGMLIK